jgi:hypothetical protein
MCTTAVLEAATTRILRGNEGTVLAAKEKEKRTLALGKIVNNATVNGN